MAGVSLKQEEEALSSNRKLGRPDRKSRGRPEGRSSQQQRPKKKTKSSGGARDSSDDNEDDEIGVITVAKEDIMHEIAGERRRKAMVMWRPQEAKT